MIAVLLIILQLIFWVAVLGIIHTYGVFPVLMKRMASKRNERPTYRDDELPRVDVIMAMYNEEAVIRATLESIVASDFPEDRLHIHIGSDGSTDDSHAIVKSIAERYPNVNLDVFSGRNGKIQIINQLVDSLPHQDEESVLILCDANVIWSPSACKELASQFKSERVGIVACNVLDSNQQTAGIAQEENAYVDQENLVKFAEGEMWGRMMGAFGACYAMRKKLYQPVPSHFNVDDFFQTMVCYEQGYDGVVNLNAICYESVSDDINEEFRRKQRISKGNFQNLNRFFTYLLPWNCGIPTSFAFWSHKGLRWIGPWLLLLIFSLGALLSVTSHWVYLIMWCGMLVSLLMVVIDRYCNSVNFKLFRFAHYFYSMNYALLLGFFEFCKGVNNSVWEPTKRVVQEHAAADSGS